MFKVGDKVIVRDNLVVAVEGEEALIGELAVITVVDEFVFPIELKFNNSRVQKFYKDTGFRRFDTYELKKVQ